ncbi:putative NAD(P)-binding protein [Seiridium unicorne]|uniref:NAD(P)-binding protein n=1 Tax=Seiridium unicorne TaxID=138068 RepID=A0ABR2VEB8_9PEZI
MAVTFDISPEKEASMGQFLKRQLFGKIPTFSSANADLKGKTAIVTGANTGLGLECSRHLLNLGANLILAVRSEARGEEARKNLLSGRIDRDAKSSPTIDIWTLDLSSYESIMAFTDRARTLPNLDVVILNAGLYNIQEAFHPKTGFEEGVQVNYLSNILLLVRLLPTLKEKNTDSSRPGRVVLVSSDMAAWSKFPERTTSPLLPFYKKKEAKWDIGERYGTTKLLGQLFLTELTKHIRASDVTVTCCNPGLCAGTDLQRGLDKVSRFVFGLIQRILAHSASVGSRVYVHAGAILGTEVHGQYVEEGVLRPMAPIVYTSEGQRLASSLYEESLNELSFGGAREIIASVSR